MIWKRGEREGQGGSFKNGDDERKCVERFLFYMKYILIKNTLMTVLRMISVMDVVGVFIVVFPLFFLRTDQLLESFRRHGLWPLQWQTKSTAPNQ